MKENYYLKCSCKHCGGHIEFPASGEGTMVNCPHCDRATILSLENAGPMKPARKRFRPGLPTAFICLLLAAGATVFFCLRHKGSRTAPALPISAANTSTNPSPAIVTNTGTQSITKPKKSASDLKVSEVRLEKTKGSSLVYAVGTVKNDSDYQRFGVRIELDLFSQKEIKVGTSQDYISILEPHHEWQFRALIPDSKAISAKVSTLKEEE